MTIPMLPMLSMLSMIPTGRIWLTVQSRRFPSGMRLEPAF